jgi:mannosyl-oligosaccharide alpha-1,2-mannosidase
MYSRSATGLSPESVVFNGCTDFSISKTNPAYMLRPEAIESFYYLNKLTGDPVYRVSHKLVKNTAPILLSSQPSSIALQEWGWEIFLSIEKYCKTKYGYGKTCLSGFSCPKKNHVQAHFPPYVTSCSVPEKR